MSRKISNIDISNIGIGKEVVSLLPTPVAFLLIKVNEIFGSAINWFPFALAIFVILAGISALFYLNKKEQVHSIEWIDRLINIIIFLTFSVLVVRILSIINTKPIPAINDFYACWSIALITLIILKLCYTTYICIVKWQSKDCLMSYEIKKIKNASTYAITGTCVPLEYIKSNDEIKLYLIKNTAYKPAEWMFPGGTHL